MRAGELASGRADERVNKEEDKTDKQTSGQANKQKSGKSDTLLIATINKTQIFSPSAGSASSNFMSASPHSKAKNLNTRRSRVSSTPDRLEKTVACKGRGKVKGWRQCNGQGREMEEQFT